MKEYILVNKEGDQENKKKHWAEHNDDDSVQRKRFWQTYTYFNVIYS